MSKYGIDVSSYQGVIDWKKVKADNIDFAILKVIKKDLSPDKYFEANWQGCIDAGVPIQGVYNYSYATTVSKAKSDANAVLKILNGRKTKVYLDVEDSCQKGLGSLLIDIINAYAEVITKAGLEFGVYTGLSFYNSYLKPYNLKYQLWIAKYGINNGILIESNKPNVPNMIGWQFTSKAKVNGINGNVDKNIWYEYVEPKKEVTPMNTVNKVIDIALAEVGYLEKKSNSNLYDKTANVGSNNYTKYGKEMHDIYPSVMDYPAYWCDAFVDWCFYKAYGVATAKSLIGGNFDDYTVASAQMYKNKKAWYTSNPKVGDQIFFKNSKRICHTGIVYKVDSMYVYTVEGNTSSGSGVVANGGCVAKKKYKLTDSSIAGYGRPKYDVVADSQVNTTTSTSTKVDTAKSFSKEMAGAYKITGNLNMRTGAGTHKSKITVIPKNGKVRCYGYYTKYDGTIWYLVAYNTYTGFVSSKYCKKL